LKLHYWGRKGGKYENNKGGKNMTEHNGRKGSAMERKGSIVGLARVGLEVTLYLNLKAGNGEVGK
jgi:hypothetical protein